MSLEVSLGVPKAQGGPSGLFSGGGGAQKTNKQKNSPGGITILDFMITAQQLQKQHDAVTRTNMETSRIQ